MAAALAKADIEGLVVHEQTDDLAVGDVDDGLSRLRIAVAGLGVWQRACLVESVQVAARQAVGLAFVQVTAQPDVSVAEREDRPRLCQQGQAQLALAERPRLDAEDRIVNHGSSNSAGSVTTMSAPRSRSSPACAIRSTPTTQATPPVPSRRHAGQGVLEDCRLRGRGAERSRAGQGGVRCALSFRVLALSDATIDALFESVLDTRGDRYLAVVAARRDDRPTYPRLRRRTNGVDRALVGLHALIADHARDDLVLAIAKVGNCLRGGRIALVAFGDVDAKPAVVARQAVDVVVVVTNQIERPKRRARFATRARSTRRTSRSWAAA